MATLVVDTEDFVSISTSVPSSTLRSSSRPSHQSKVTVTPPGKPRFDFSRISAESEDLHSVTEDMLCMLHLTINQEFNLQAGVSQEELFHLPHDIHTYSLVDQLSFIKDLLYRVCRSYLQTLAPADPTCLESSPIKLDSKPKPKTFVLSQEEYEALRNLVNASTKTSDSSESSPLHIKYADIGRKLLESQALLRRCEDDMEALSEVNRQMKNRGKLMELQIRGLESQLAESIEETYRLEDSLKQAYYELPKLRSKPFVDVLSVEVKESSGQTLQSTPSVLAGARFSFSDYL
jgi:hypothetical protein